MIFGHHGYRSVFIAAGLIIPFFLFLFSRLELNLSTPSAIVHRYDTESRTRSDISNATLGFQKLLVINMPSRTDRRDATSLAAAVSGLQIDFITGVDGDSVPEAALPPSGSTQSVKLSKGIRGSWRSHMNALQSVVSQNLSTAVIFEDDVDWDVRLRSELEHFAKASRVLTNEPLDLSDYPVVTSNNPENEDSIHSEVSQNEISSSLFSLPLSNIPLPTSTAPYGDPSKWDVLWLGHCGVGFPRPSGYPAAYDERNIILTLADDETVPQPRYLRAHPFGPLDALAESHPPHTRVFHRASGGALCTVAYAVSQRGARRLLQEYSVTKWSKIWDGELGDWCAGTDSFWRKSGERKCITSQPPIFAHHHPAGGRSNIGGLGGGYATSVETKYLRFSVRMNLQALVRNGGPEELEDQWPDKDDIQEEGETVRK